MNLELSDEQKGFLEYKSNECGCSCEEFLILLMERDMETDCRYLRLDIDPEDQVCGINGDTCLRFRKDPTWLRGHECEVAIDHEYDLKTVDRVRM